MMDVAAREKLGELNAEIFEEAKGHGVEVADVHSAFEGHALEYTNISSMDIHPNKEGHSAIYSLLSGLTAEQTSAPVTGAVTARLTARKAQLKLPREPPQRAAPTPELVERQRSLVSRLWRLPGVFACRKRK